MNPWKTAALALVGLALGAGLTSCVPPSERTKIGFLVKMPEESWFQIEGQFAEEAGRDLGFEVLRMGIPDGQAALAAIDSLAAQGAAGFVICAPDPKLGPALLARAEARGLKMLTVDDRLVGADGRPLAEVPYVGISAAAIGWSVGRALWEERVLRGWRADETGALAITYEELETARERVDAATSALITAGFPADMVVEVPQRTTDTEGGLNAALPIPAKRPEIRHWLVYGLNDETVVGAVGALEARGFAPDDVVGVGINGMATAIHEFQRPGPSGFAASVLLDARTHGYETTAAVYRWVTEGRVPDLDQRTTGTIIHRGNWKAVLREKGLESLFP